MKAGAVLASRYLPLLILCFAGAACHANRISVMSYNVENLFDDVHDGTEFREFDPDTESWSPELFKARVSAIADVIRKAVPGGPDLIALQEVENSNALRILVDDGLKGLGYTRTLFIPKRGLTANVAIISRLPVARVHSYEVRTPAGGLTRDILEAEILVGSDTIHLMDNHWKSKTGGVRETEESRVLAAGVLRKRILQILDQDPLADIIAAGDMNESVDERARGGNAYQTALVSEDAVVPSEYSLSSIFLDSHPGHTGVFGDRLILYEPWYESAGDCGSYAYGRKWETFDHLLLSAGMFDGRGLSYVRGSFRVFKEAFLLSEAGFPKKWEGTRSQGGFSDHLPILIEIERE